MNGEYLVLAYIVSVAGFIGTLSIWQGSDVGIGFAGGIITGAYGAFQPGKRNPTTPTTPKSLKDPENLNKDLTKKP